MFNQELNCACLMGSTYSTSKVTLKNGAIGYIASINVNSRSINGNGNIRITFEDSSDNNCDLTYYVNSESCLNITSSHIVNINFGIDTDVVNSTNMQINELIIIIRLRMKLLYHLTKQLYIVDVIVTYVVAGASEIVLLDDEGYNKSVIISVGSNNLSAKNDSKSGIIGRSCKKYSNMGINDSVKLSLIIISLILLYG